jgi:hypothetical protein
MSAPSRALRRTNQARGAVETVHIRALCRKLEDRGNKAPEEKSGYERVNDLVGGHSVPEVRYDRFANGRLEGFGLIVDFMTLRPTRPRRMGD